MRLYHVFAALIGLLMALLSAPAVQAQSLPQSPWYAVLYQPETDTLHWMNQNGEQASMPRPALANEAQ